MANTQRRRVALFLIGLLIGAVVVLGYRCSRRASAPGAAKPTERSLAVAPPTSPQNPAVPPPAAAEELLSAATLEVPPSVKAGAKFPVKWTGPDNPEDFITIVHPTDAEGSYQNHRMTRDGSAVELTAPMSAGGWEVRYVTGRSRKALARVPITVGAVEATLNAPAEAGLGKEISVDWSGPNNQGDYITVVEADAPEGHYGNHAYTAKSSPLMLTMPPQSGEFQLRYVSGQGAKVLARRGIRVLAPDIRLTANEQATAGSTLQVEWAGPGNRGDSITIVAASARDGVYGNYTDVAKGSPLNVVVPIEPGEAEIRYMTAQGSKVLGRRSLRVVPAEIRLDAAAEVDLGARITIDWKGPGNRGDYVTIVPASAKDGVYGSYAETEKGSPLTLTAPKEPGAAEIRYVSGQGSKVLARRAVIVRAPTVE